MVNISLYELKMVKEHSGRYDVNRIIKCPKDAVNIANTVLELNNKAEEELILVTLNTKNNVTGLFVVSKGSLNSSIVHPREIFKRALINNAAFIILLHNHPSEDPSPSNEDINITNRIKEAGKIIGIELIDHIIIGGNKFISLKEKALL